MTTYKNPWHIKNGHQGPENYATDARPEYYKGYSIYNRIPGHVWDVVKDDICITQRAGINGAKRAIDFLVYLLHDFQLLKGKENENY